MNVWRSKFHELVPVSFDHRGHTKRLIKEDRRINCLRRKDIIPQVYRDVRQRF